MTGQTNRRGILRQAAGVMTVPLIAGTGAGGAAALAQTGPAPQLPDGVTDRADAVALLRRMAQPVVSRMAKGRLQREWSPELSPIWDGRNPRVGYMEAFARLADGIAPWLALPVDSSEEGKLRGAMRDDMLACLTRSVTPGDPDYLLWRGAGQALVDSAYFTSALIRAPQALWDPLDASAKRRIVEEIKRLRSVSPPYQNWLLFAAMNEVFLLSVGEEWDPMRVDLTIKKFKEWYAGDGWYGDGERFHFDYYNSYVIHPMLVQILEVLVREKPRFNNLKPAEELALAIRRMQRFSEHLERLIGPDGAYPPIGRSLTYRTAVLQPLGYLAWRGLLPDTLAPGQVRSASMAVQRRIFSAPSNFDDRGFLTIGFVGYQPQLGDRYSNAGSMYIASEGLVALGLPPDHPYWTAPAEPWTMRRAYSGMAFRKDYAVDY
ncbi:DUF2264 domain-containing protein [Sphingomonas sp. BGYR3]|uniref:DUF2264 domain-containing protein n=1 Tax=Sphingomonas sp. BGYR3 TaxID=2975483 RepID=UPI0021A4377B|nr:DUF2264 domain-containing protein [Sphingomonas sp. BGYR3]MDG5488797.1 DUF2264 domain-containing protein [Sphingomonas sp. BGYR3]